jgi:hypothetical protein
MNRTKSVLLVGLLGLACLVLPGALRADTFDWSYTCETTGCTDDASGTLITGAFSGGVATILSIAGTYDGSTITGLLSPGTCCSSPANDNLLYFPGPPYLDLGGLGFSAASLDINLYLASGTTGYADLVCTSGATCGSTTTSVSGGIFSVVPTPEPSALLLLFVGLAVLISLGYKRPGVRVQLT